MVDNVVIMAGGAGKRLWPASLGKRPKQFMSVGGDSSLFLGTVTRAFDLDISGRVYVVTHEDHISAAIEECRRLGSELRKRVVLVGEPVARNTAPALALAAAVMELDGKEKETCLVMAADHLISPKEAFLRSVETASGEAETGFIVPYGIPPRFAATGYGYIEAGEWTGGSYTVKSFREKPDAETAAEYLKSGRHFWNAGLFTYRNDVFSDELRQHSPDVAAIFAEAAEDWIHRRKSEGVEILEPSDELRRRYEICPSISIDYAVMERTSAIRMVKADFDWNDVGSWDVVAEIGTDHHDEVYSVESAGNFVYADRPVALCGVEDLIVVVANGRVMICRRGMSQLVKAAAEAEAKRSESSGT